MGAPARIRQLELCDPSVFGDVVVVRQTAAASARARLKVWTRSKSMSDCPTDDKERMSYERRRASALLDQLLLDIYSSSYYTCHWTLLSNANHISDANSSASGRKLSRGELVNKNVDELRRILSDLNEKVVHSGGYLIRILKRRDALRRQRDARCDVVSYVLRKRLPEFAEMRFSIGPPPGDSGFTQWHSAMKMVARLPEGIPPEFRRRLWLSLADKHLTAKGVDWRSVERNCFSEWSHPADAELGVQIVKDLHRTGCSLFCGENGQENQALLKRVLLAYARWNKNVGYCQGFNMLAALLLQVTERNESEALKLMIYLIEGVLPESYFADSLRGLSVDMAVFRELLRTKLPRLSRHLDSLQIASKEGTTSYEPPLTNVFTMQWFLTLFCNCLPQPTVLRVWDLIMLEGNEILLRTALAIWSVLADRIMHVRTADEFYCIMGVLMREILEYDLIDANALIKGIVKIGSLGELQTLREHYLYNINPWGSTIAATDKSIKVYSKEKLVLDIGVLKKQYVKLKQRQRQAHVIFNAVAKSRTSVPRPTPVAVNHLLLGKSALVTAKRIGPPKGSIPPARLPVNNKPAPPPKTIHWKDTRQDSSSSSSDTELCDDPEKVDSDIEEEVKKIEELPLDNLPEPPERNRSDSLPSEDGFDFEQFLQERVKSFKEGSPPDEELERVKYARRNSQKALEIIQENSLILHRILQCQSRLSPSPPLGDEVAFTPDLVYVQPEDDISKIDYDLEMYRQKLNSPVINDPVGTNPFRADSSTIPEESTDDSVYSSSLTLSKSDENLSSAKSQKTLCSSMSVDSGNDEICSSSDLNTSYTNLCNRLSRTSSLLETMKQDLFKSRQTAIVKPIQCTNAECDSNSPTAPAINNLLSPTNPFRVEIEESSASAPIEIAKTSKYNSILEYSRDLDEKFNNLILNNKSAEAKAEESKIFSPLRSGVAEEFDFARWQEHK